MKPMGLLSRCRRGSVTVLAAAVFPVLIGVAGLVTEYGDALLTKVRLQRVADAAAYGGALAFNAAGTTDALNKAVARVATLNGIATTAAVGSIQTSPTGSGNSAVRVIVTGSVPLGLSKLINHATSDVAVSATAFVELRANANGIPCIIALNSAGTGVTLSGGTALSAPNCAISTNASITVPNGTSVTTPVVTYNSASAPTSNTVSNIHAPAGVSSVSITRKPVSNPLSGSAAVAAATAHLSSVALMAGPAAPSPPASSNSPAFGYQGPNFDQTVNGCRFRSANWSGIWTVDCAGAGPFNFSNLTVPGGNSVTFNNATAATYNFSGAITNSGATLVFNGTGTYNIAQGIITNGGTTTLFPAGTYNIGMATSNCGGSGGRFSVCHSGATLVFGGPSTFAMSGGIYNAGGSLLALGSGFTNSYRIGASSNGNALWAGGGSKTSFADATGASSVFQMAGTLNIASGGGSCLTLPAAADHDINGNFSTAGGTLLGAGTYTINGYAALGANGGGDVTCGGGATVGIAGTSVAFVISASTTIGSGTCSGTTFCVAAGYGHVTLTAPTSGTLRDLLVIGPTTSTNTAGANFAEGASGTSLSGTFYIPYGPFTLGGGANVGNGTGQCLEVIAAQVSLTGGTTLASLCAGLGQISSASSIALVQ
ncbi:MAG: pilus assembly protein TadG-related protein [Acetobacteraceae bacterium]